MRAWRYGRLLIPAVLAFAAIALAGCGKGGDKKKEQTDQSGLGIQIEQPAQTFEVIGPAPDYKLINQDGKEVNSQDLRGKVLLYNFVYTNCSTVCPMVSALFAQTRDELKKEGLLGDKVMLVTISFDPERDTPEVMKKYGEKYGVDPANWLWLTGTPEEIKRVVRDGFMVGYEKVPAAQKPAADATTSPEHKHGKEDPPPPPGYDLEHTAIIVLVDKDGKMRAVYPAGGMEPKQFVDDIKRLMKMN